MMFRVLVELGLGFGFPMKVGTGSKTDTINDLVGMVGLLLVMVTASYC